MITVSMGAHSFALSLIKFVFILRVQSRNTPWFNFRSLFKSENTILSILFIIDHGYVHFQLASLFDLSDHKFSP